MYYRPYARPRLGFVVALFLVIAFAGGVLVERFHLLPGSGPHAPAEVGSHFDIFWEAWDLVDEHYVDRAAIKPLNMTRGAIQGMLASLGDIGHTTFVTPEQYKALSTELEGHVEGIGATLTMAKNVPTVVTVLPGSPAQAGGVKPGDVLVEVDHKPVTNLSIDRIVAMVRGPAGSTVHLELIHKGQNKPVELEIRRGKVEVPDTTWHLLPGVPLAHIAIQEFGKNADRQLREAVQKARDKGVKGLIIDLRGCPGGLKDQAVAVTSEFLKEGNVFLEKNAEGEVKNVPVKPGGQILDLPLTLLIDGGTASSAEIFAGALQDYHRGKLIGDKTAGTGTVLEPFKLSDGSVVLLAVTLWLTPKGRQIWHQGIAPDIEVSLPADAKILRPEMEDNLTADDLAKSTDTQLRRAIEVLQGK
jgi:carboxyl-terminal processing protease